MTNEEFKEKIKDPKFKEEIENITKIKGSARAVFHLINEDLKIMLRAMCLYVKENKLISPGQFLDYCLENNEKWLFVFYDYPMVANHIEYLCEENLRQDNELKNRIRQVRGFQRSRDYDGYGY